MRCHTVHVWPNPGSLRTVADQSVRPILCHAMGPNPEHNFAQVAPRLRLELATCSVSGTSNPMPIASAQKVKRQHGPRVCR